MESGSGSQNPGPFGPGSPGYGPGGKDDDSEEEKKGPQSPAPGGPQSPGPQGPPLGEANEPQSPPPSPAGPQSPADPGSSGLSAPPPGQGSTPAFAPPGGAQPPAFAPPEGSQAPPPPGHGGPQAPGYGGPQAPGYGGPVPPGGWQQPLSTPGFQVAPGQLASWGSRAGAYLIDLLILVAVVTVGVLLIVGIAAANTTAGIVLGIILGIAMVVVLLGYAPYLLARSGERNGQTYGKQAVNIRVVLDSGQPIGLGQGFLREFAVKGLLFGTVGSFFLYIPTLLDWLWPLWDDQDRALHDMIVSTHVIKAG